MIVTIDGYAGTGKSTAAKKLAAALGFEVLNTGAMYRVAGMLLKERHGLDVFGPALDQGRVAAALADWRFELPPGRILLNGEDVTPWTKSEESGSAASKAGLVLVIRRSLQAEQRRLADGRDVVCEGRDQGSVVFPKADHKFFLRTDSLVRALRRSAELNDPDVEKLRVLIEARDLQDETRDLDPLVRPFNSIEIDTGLYNADGVVAEMLKAIRGK